MYYVEYINTFNALYMLQIFFNRLVTLTHMKLNKPIRPATGELWLYYLHDANKITS